MAKASVNPRSGSITSSSVNPQQSASVRHPSGTRVENIQTSDLDLSNSEVQLSASVAKASTMNPTSGSISTSAISTQQSASVKQYNESSV